MAAWQPNNETHKTAEAACRLLCSGASPRTSEYLKGVHFKGAPTLESCSRYCGQLPQWPRWAHWLSGAPEGPI
eukprot:13647302-Alexandrium_andersonii.AAC.1